MLPLPVPTPSLLFGFVHCSLIFCYYLHCFENPRSLLVIISYCIVQSSLSEFKNSKMASFECGLTAEEEELLDAREEVRADVPAVEGSGPAGDLVAGGVQVPDALELDPENFQIGELVGSGQVLRGEGAVGDALYQEWRYTSEIQRDLAARHLMAVALPHRLGVISK